MVNNVLIIANINITISYFVILPPPLMRKADTSIFLFFAELTEIVIISQKFSTKKLNSMYYITNVFDSNTFILQNHKLCSIINMKKEEKTDVEAVSLFSEWVEKEVRRYVMTSFYL